MSDKKDITDLNDHKIIKAIEEQTPFNRENSNIVEAIEEAKERGKMYKFLEEKESTERKARGEEPNPCFNAVCEHYRPELDRLGYCAQGSECHGCMYQMLSRPPNSLNYNEHMPSHQEALDRLEKHGLLKGDREEYEKDYVRYQAATTQEERWQHDLAGATLCQLEAAAKNVISEAIERGYNDDAEVMAKNICIEMEKVLGIYPNIKGLR